MGWYINPIEKPRICFCHCTECAFVPVPEIQTSRSIPVPVSCCTMTPTSNDSDGNVKAFPLQARVVLQGLNKAPEFNGKQGVVMSTLKDGRQQVLVGKKFLGLKPSNMTYQLRPFESLNMQELKKILSQKDPSLNFAGMDASDLRRDVTLLGQEVAFEYLAIANANEFVEKEKAKEQQAQEDHKNIKSRADQISGMSPDQLRRQARMMRTLPADQIRKSHPQLRHMTDAEIQDAATQMEQMAENPELVRMAAEQVKNMSPEEYERAQQQHLRQQNRPGRGGRRGNRKGTASVPEGNPMDDMTPEQLKQQAKMMRSMTPAQIRKLNPQLASLTDEQVEQTVVQMEQMASNPEMFKMAKEQMKGMSKEEIANIKAGGAVPPGMDPSKMLETMDGKQLKQMLKMMKENPEVLKQMGGQGEQMMKALQMFEGMDEAQLESAVNMMKGVQKATAPVRNAYSKLNSLCGGHLIKVLLLLFALYFGMFIFFRFFVAVGSEPEATIEALVNEQDIVPVPELHTSHVEDSEF